MIPEHKRRHCLLSLLKNAEEAGGAEDDLAGLLIAHAGGLGWLYAEVPLRT